MKYLVYSLMMVMPMCADAQLVCKVYQQIQGMESKRCVLTTNYDEMGRPVREKVSGYAVCLENAGTMYCCREDGVYDYYYDDTILYKMVITELDDLTKRPVDSGKVFYHHDSATGRLNDDLTVKHLKIRRPGVKPGGYRNTITYTYDNEGRIIIKDGANGRNTAEYMSYDSKGRLLSDSISSFGDNFRLVSRYEYIYDGYRVYEWSSDRRYPQITVVRTDEKGRITEKATWFHRREDIDGGSGMHSFNWSKYLGNDLTNFKQYERTVTSYNEQGQIAESKYYFEGKHTTTHTYVYEQGSAGS